MTEPVLTAGPRPDPSQLRQRTTLIGMVVGGLVLLLLVLMMFLPSRDRTRTVVVAGPAGSRIALDGQPQPVLGSDGTHLLQVAPGTHDVVLTLRNGTTVQAEIEVEAGEGSVLLEARRDKVKGRWEIRPTGQPQPEVD